MTCSNPIKAVSQHEFIHAAMDPTHDTPMGLVGPDGVTSPKRFAVYRNNILVSLKDALATGFPATASLVGSEFFSAMSDVYARSTPPMSPILALYGDRFPAFISGFPPAQSLPYLADVAKLEYALRCSYHAEDAAPVAAALLQDPRLFTARIQLAPAVQVLEFAYPVTQIHAATTGGPAPTGGAEDVLITRPEFDPIATSFPSGTRAILHAIQAQNTLGDAIELAPAELDLTALITALISGGAITHLEFENV